MTTLFDQLPQTRVPEPSPAAGGTLRALLFLVAIALRLAIATGTRHQSSDMDYWFSMRKAFLLHGFAAYSNFTTYLHHDWPYPYPPGLIPWILASIWMGDWLAIPRDVAVKLPFILADACLVLVVVAALDRRGAAHRIVILAASLIVFGPTFVVVSAYHGQFDSVAILPAAIAVLLWDRERTPARGLVCGVLIGVGAAMKTIPAFATLALLPTVRSWREAFVLTSFTVAVPVLAMLPFFLVDPQGVTRSLGYSGLPGLGGWSVIVQPDLVRMWLLGEPATLTPASTLLFHYGARVSVVALGAVGALLLWRRTSAIEASCAVWLTVYATAANYFAAYANWGLPFLLMAGRIREVALLTAFLLPITLISYVRPEIVSASLASVYQVLAIGLQLTFVSMWVREMIRIGRTVPR